MGRHKEMPGETYQIIDNDGQSATVEFTYLCPYCMSHTTSRKTYYSDIDMLERGGFGDNLECEWCGKIASVRFWSNCRID